MVLPSETQRLLAKVNQIGELLRSPNVPGQVHHAEMLAISVSQGAPSGAIADLALQIVTALGAIERYPEAPEYMVALDTALRRLREALGAVERGKER